MIRHLLALVAVLSSLTACSSAPTKPPLAARAAAASVSASSPVRPQMLAVGHAGAFSLTSSTNPGGAGAVFDCGNGSVNTVTDVWENTSGSPVSIMSIHTWLGADGNNLMYDLGFSITRLSDHAVVLFNNWDRYAQPTGLSDKEYQYLPGGVVMAPGDSLYINSWCASYTGPGFHGSVVYTLRYVM